MNGGCSASTAATSIAFMSEHPLDVLFTAARDGESVVVPPGWGQGRATFGGVVAGAMLSRVLAAYRHGYLRLGPLVAGQEGSFDALGDSATRLERFLTRCLDRVGDDRMLR